MGKRGRLLCNYNKDKTRTSELQGADAGFLLISAFPASVLSIFCTSIHLDAPKMKKFNLFLAAK
jgi:ABC-type amino acid transport system permease subunit